MSRPRPASTSALLVALLVACDQAPTPAADAPTRPRTPVEQAAGAQALAAARADLPTLLDVQTKVIQRTCSPNPGTGGWGAVRQRAAASARRP